MRSLALLAALCLASTADAQSIFEPGFSGAVGPWQPSRTGGWNYYNHSAPVYPVAAPYYRGGYGRSYGGGYQTFLQQERNDELRSIRWELESQNRRRAWR